MAYLPTQHSLMLGKFLASLNGGSYTSHTPFPFSDGEAEGSVQALLLGFPSGFLQPHFDLGHANGLFTFVVEVFGRLVEGL